MHLTVFFLLVILKLSFCDNYFTVQVGCHEDLRSFKATLLQHEAKWWTELGEKLLIKGTKVTKQYLLEQKISFTTNEVIPNTNAHLAIVKRFHSRELEKHQLSSLGSIIEQGHGYSVFQLHSQTLSELVSNPNYNFASSKIRLLPFRENLSLATLDCNTENWKSIKKDSPDPNILSFVNSLNMTRWTQDLQYLSSLNRYALSSQINTAMQYIINKLSEVPNMVVTTQNFTFGSGNKASNIIGTLQGTTNPDVWVIVGAHYDSTSQSVSTAAPGAEDNGSGTVSVLELARVFGRNPPQVTMIFILYGAEEEGLYGSIAHSQGLVASGNANKVKIAHTMDMVAYRAPSSTSAQVLLESSNDYQYLFTPYTAAAALYTLNSLETVYSSNPFGSDHVPYINRNIPALLCIDNDWDKYPDYHETTDTFDKLNIPIATDILRMNAAALAAYTNATFVPDTQSSACAIGASISLFIALLL